MLWKDEMALIRRNDKELLRIEPWGENGLRIRATQLNRFQDDEIGALSEDLKKCSENAAIEILEDTAVITNGKLRCEVLCTGKLKFYNQKGELLTEDCYRNRYGKQAPGESNSALEYLPRVFIPHRGTDHFQLTARFEAKEGEKFFGMGQYAFPHLDLKGCMLELAQRNSQVTIPFMMSNRGYGFLWNNPAIGKALFGRNMTEWTADSTKQLDYWICAGDTPAEIEEAYAAVTGTVPKMPEYATGLWQSKLRYRTQEELLEVAREYKRRGLPLSVIVIDFFHWTAQGDWKFDPQFWPDPVGMVKELKEMGVELMISIWPTVESQSENYQYMEEMGYLIRTEAGPRLGIKNQDTYFDATNPQAREFVWEKIKENYYDKGIRLFWLDECEPEVTKYEYDNYRFWMGTDKEIGNLYPRENSRMVYEGRRREGEEKIVSLTRCAWAGSQKYGALVWTGDISSNFECLRNQLANALNMGIAGMPWWTTDIGGFHEGNTEDPLFRECLIRWFEFAVFCPVLRMHGFREPKVIDANREFKMGDASSWKFTSGSPNELWSFGSEVYEILKHYLLIREKIRPYVSELMDEAHEKGTPLMRPMFYDYPERKDIWEIEDQYMFGHDFVVAPVLYSKCESREVYLPEGKWYSLHTGEEFAGEKTYQTETPLEIIPVFVRDGRYQKLFA